MSAEQSMRVDEVTTHGLAPSSTGPHGVVRALVARIAPGESTGWHRHDGWQTGIVASGRLRHRTADTVRHFGPGDVLVETPSVDHEATNVSDEELVLVFVAVHPTGCAPATPRPAP